LRTRSSQQRKIQEILRATSAGLILHELLLSQEAYDSIPKADPDPTSPRLGERDTADAGHDVDSQRLPPERRHAVGPREGAGVRSQSGEPKRRESVTEPTRIVAGRLYEQIKIAGGSRSTVNGQRVCADHQKPHAVRAQ
jgi:hypothetical protein